MATSTGTSTEDAWQNLKSRRSGLSNNNNNNNNQSKFGQDTVSASRLPRLLMVHQLWLWKLDADTVVTAFPDRYHQGVEDTLFETVRQGNIETYTRPEQLVENILFETVTFLEEYRYAGLGIHVLEIFESSIAVRVSLENQKEHSTEGTLIPPVKPRSRPLQEIPRLAPAEQTLAAQASRQRHCADPRDQGHT